MIIVEGSDGAGKTTLVTRLAEEFDLEIGERGTANRDRLYEVTRMDTYSALASMVEGHIDPLIWDRLFYSEMIYAPLKPRPVEFSEPEQDFVKRIIRAAAVPIVVCRPPIEVVKENAAKEHQMESVLENIQTIYNQYTEAFAGHPNVMWYDYTGKLTKGGYVNYTQMVERLAHYIRNRKKREW